MKLSTRGRYAMRAMLELALHTEEGPVSRAEIAQRQGLSPNYIAHLFRKLEQAGLVQSVKGPGGGYRLGRHPAEISIGEILRTVEGPIALVHCVTPEGQKRCHRAENCVTRCLWQQVSEALAGVLDSVTLQDLRDRARTSP